MARQYAPVVDIVRCAAASLVAVFHLGCTWWHGVRQLLVELDFPRIVGNDHLFFFGFVGVEIFFVISGYVIAMSCIGRTPREFVIGRAIRLMPALWLATLVGAILLFIAGGNVSQLLMRSVGSALLFPAGPYIDPVVWTLVIEVMFYGMIWLLLLVTGRDVERWLPVFAAVLATASAVNLGLEINGIKLGNLMPQLLLLRHGGLFALGIMIWAYSSGRARPNAMTVVALASCAMELYVIVGERNLEAGTRFSFLIPLAIWAVAIAFVWYGATHTRPAASRAVRTAGLMTYPIYLTHQTVGGAAAAFAINALGIPLVPAIVIGLIAVALTSWVIVGWIEPGVRVQFQRLLEIVVPGARAVAA